jgi:hypothetical protein
MNNFQEKLRVAAVGLLCSSHLGFGIYAGSTAMMVCGTAGLVYTAWAMNRIRRAARGEKPELLPLENAHA